MEQRMATLEDLAERIKKVEDILNFSLRQIDKLLGDIDKQIDTKMKVKEMEILKTLKRYLEEQIQNIGERVENNLNKKFKGEILEIKENIYKYFLPSIEEQLGKVAKDWDKQIQELIKTKSEKVAKKITKSEVKFSLLKEEKEFERGMILDALRKANYVQTNAAEMLGISRRILKYKMDKLRITEKVWKDKLENLSNKRLT
jgi:DNA-binding NtrC family response regulator